MSIKIFKPIFILLLLCGSIAGQYSIYESLDENEIKFSFEDFGTMWTFDDIPYDLWKEKYGFTPGEEWLEHVQKSALQFGGGCSAAFVSGDGLIMTNHHCGRGAFPGIQKEDENLLRDGFYANTLEEERPVPNFYVDQLVKIEDVTDSVQNVMSTGKNHGEQIELRDKKIGEIVDRAEKELGLKCKVITLYNGGKYSLYFYKRYNDIRLVMAPDFQIAATGWDWDNFTYPRYELDFAFYRAYDESGIPIKSPHYFSWSAKGALEGEPIFIIGRPGNTDRLVSASELLYYRDYKYPVFLNYYNQVYEVYFKLYKEQIENQSENLHRLLSSGNGRKSYAGRLLGLKDNYLMAKKTDFENQLKDKIKLIPELGNRYENIWSEIENHLKILIGTNNEYYAYTFFMSFNKPKYFSIAENIIKYAEQLKLPSEERSDAYKDENLDKTKQNIFTESYDKELNELLIQAHANFLSKSIGTSNQLVQKVYGGKAGKAAVDYALSKSLITSKESLMKFLEYEPDSILNSSDPFIHFVKYAKEKADSLSKLRKEAENSLAILNQELGKLIFKIYSNKVSPDATSSLRISDGVISGYEYNGTLAPGKTTFFGLWDKYFSFNQNEYPWGLHERWKVPPPDLDLSVPVCFASTNDIVGGNSGSSLINIKGEIVGLAHDGNLESLAGHFAFLPENNRTVATDSWGLMEALKYIYKTDRLVKELLDAKIKN